MPIALQRIPAYIISSRDMGVHAGFMLHGLGKNSGPRTLIPVVELLLRNSCAMRSHRPPRSTVREDVRRRIIVDLGCSTALREHTNTVK